MAGKTKMRDMIVILPGLMGSELQKHGRDVWAPTAQAVGNLLFSRFQSVLELEMKGDDPALDDLEDGVQATKILDDIVVFPGLIKLDGYSGLRRMITSQFDVLQGSMHNPSPANYFEFFYDWRRDMRFNARKLHEFVEKRLPEWQALSGAADARVILIGHSMGGLISRYYLERMEGWKQCKALISLGSPHRGAVNAAETLGNGFQILGLDLSGTLRSLPSMYQILPIYPVVEVGSEVVPLTNPGAVPGLEQDNIVRGTSFLLDIAEAVKENKKIPAYQNQGYQMIPVVGTRQPTNQSLRLENGRFKPLRTSRIMDDALTHGDNTVPFISAIPIELSDTYRDSFFTVTHGSIQNSPVVLDHLQALLTRMQFNLAAFSGLPDSKSLDMDTALSLDIPDYVEAGAPLFVTAEAFDADDSLQLTAKIESLTVNESPRQIPLKQDDSRWRAAVEGLASGYYRLTLSANSPGVIPLTDLFIVA